MAFPSNLFSENFRMIIYTPNQLLSKFCVRRQNLKNGSFFVPYFIYILKNSTLSKFHLNIFRIFCTLDFFCDPYCGNLWIFLRPILWKPLHWTLPNIPSFSPIWSYVTHTQPFFRYPPVASLPHSNRPITDPIPNTYAKFNSSPLSKFRQLTSE